MLFRSDPRLWEEWLEYLKWLGATVLGEGWGIAVVFCILSAIVTSPHTPRSLLIRLVGPYTHTHTHTHTHVCARACLGHKESYYRHLKFQLQG